MLNMSQLTIRAKFTILAIMVCAVPLFIVSLISVNSSITALKNLLAEELKNKTTIVGQQIDTFFDQRISDMRVISQADVLEATDKNQIRQYLSEVLEANPSIADFVVLNASGAIIASAGEQARIDQNMKKPAIQTLFSDVLRSKQGDVYLSDAIPTSDGNSVFLATPITDDTNTIVEGILLGEVSMKPIEAIIAEFDESVIGDKSVYLLNDDSQVIVTSDNQQTLFDKFNDLKVHPEVAKATEVDGSNAYVIYDDYHNDHVMAGMADMRAHGANQALDWGIIAVAEMEAIAAPAYELRNMIAIISVVAVLIAGFIASTLSSVLTAPLAKIKNKLQELAQGGGDLTVRLDITSHDEVGKVAMAFNNFVDNIHRLIKDLKASADELTSVASDMTSLSDQSRIECEKQKQETEMVAAAVHQMSTAAGEIAFNAQKASDSAQHADTVAKTGGKVVNDAIHSTEKLVTEIESATRVISVLEGNVNDISDMVDVIRGIAEQTNLLALNAAIEAARAGEQGRGFAVVADEVRSLASKTQESTDKINALIEQLQAGSKNAVMSMEKSQSAGNTSVSKANEAGLSLTQIVTEFSTISEMNLQIAAASEEQTSVTHDLTQNITSIADATASLVQTVNHANNSTQKLSDIGYSLKTKVERFVI